MKKLISILLVMLLLTGCSAADKPTESVNSTTAPTVTQPNPTDPPITEPPVTEPPVTEPPTTEPPEDPPVEEPFEAHENFDAEQCASLLGTWSTKITLSGEIQNLELFTGKTEFMLHFTFDGEGRFRAWADETEFTNAIDDFAALMVDHMVELRFATFRGPLEYQGVEDEEILERWGSGPEQQARQECEDSVAALNLYHRFKRLLREGQYYVNGNKLYTQLSDEKFEANGYVVNGKVMSLNNTNNMTIYRDICVEFPLIFNKEV